MGVLGLKSKVLITGKDAKVTSQQIHVHVTLADVKRTKTDERTLSILCQWVKSVPDIAGNFQVQCIDDNACMVWITKNIIFLENNDHQTGLIA